ncbi:MAG: hypothetical protein ABH821_04565 [archaeon]
MGKRPSGNYKKRTPHFNPNKKIRGNNPTLKELIEHGFIPEDIQVGKPKSPLKKPKNNPGHKRKR